MPKVDIAITNDQSKCNTFVMMGTEHYFLDPKCYQQSKQAKDAGVAVVVLLHDGVQIPELWPLDRSKAAIRRFSLDEDPLLAKKAVEEAILELEERGVFDDD